MRWTRGAAFLSVLLIGAALVAGTAGSVPDQASDQGELHSHGPDPKEMYRPGRAPAASAFAVDSPAPWAPATWDDVGVATDLSDTTSQPTIHMIYVHPSDKPSRFSTFGAMFEADAKQANDLLVARYGRGVRFDYRSDGHLDITVVKSTSNNRRLSSGNQFSLVSNELKNRGFTNANKKYAVWLDAGSNYCGQGTLYQDTRRTSNNYSNVNRTTGIVYRPYATDNGEGGFCRGRTLLHELGHNMGAVQKVAPNAFDGAHCDDDQEDVMCYEQNATFDSGNVGQFDYGNDDYWDPAANPALGSSATLPWWTLNLSRFICPTTGCA